MNRCLPENIKDAYASPYLLVYQDLDSTFGYTRISHHLAEKLVVQRPTSQEESDETCPESRGSRFTHGLAV